MTPVERQHNTGDWLKIDYSVICNLGKIMDFEALKDDISEQKKSEND